MKLHNENRDCSLSQAECNADIH